jgi:hypothetical protein
MKILVILGVSLLCIVFADIAPGDDSAQGTSSVAVSKKTLIEPYCGIRSLYAAMRVLGKQVVFSDLIEPQYIDSRQGSSIVGVGVSE